MTPQAFRRAAAATALLAVACTAASLVLWLAAAGFDLGRSVDPSSFVSLAGRLPLLRASLAFDVAGYVLIVPLVAHLWSELEPVHAARSRLYAAGGLAYSLVGATGAVVLLAAWPPLMRGYAAAIPADRAVIRAVFEAFTEVVYRGMWNVVGVAGLGVWLLGTGRLLAPWRRGLGLLASVAGAFALADAVLALAGARGSAVLALGAAGTLALAWIAWVSIELLGDGPALVTKPGRSAGTPISREGTVGRGT